MVLTLPAKRKHYLPNEDIVCPNGTITSTTSGLAYLEANNYEVKRNYVVMIAVAHNRSIQLSTLLHVVRRELHYHVEEQQFAEDVMRLLRKDYLKST